MALLKVSECKAVGIDGVHGHGTCVCVYACVHGKSQVNVTHIDGVNVH